MPSTKVVFSMTDNGNDDDFYSRDRPADATMPEDRPRGGGTEDPEGGFRFLWVVILIVFLIVAILGFFMLP
ncbi:hypothetical protein ACIQNI_27000 [Streptomyces sp. NPDC091266]|uniref:hypothetical protein n=1 Tax=unclassified Streptomyces TaxID=2593676 RepID=UPI00380B3C92